MSEVFRLFVTCPRGLEPLLATELLALEMENAERRREMEEESGEESRT